MPGQSADGDRERSVDRQALLDTFVLVVGQVEREPETCASPRLDTVTATRFVQDVLRDPEQPRQRRAVTTVAEAMTAQPRLRKRLARQIRSQVVRAPLAPTKDGGRVTLVQFPERRRVNACRTDQFGVASLHTPLSSSGLAVYPAGGYDAVKPRLKRR